MPPRPSRRDLLLTATAATAACLLGGGGCGVPALTDASPPTRLLPKAGDGGGAVGETPAVGGVPAIGGAATGDAGGAGPALSPPPGWAVGVVSPAGLAVRFADPRPIAGATRFRVTCAADLRADPAAGGRTDVRVRVALAVSGRPLGEIALRGAYPLQPFDLPLSAADGEAARREGVRLSADRPVTIFVVAVDPVAAGRATSDGDSAAVGSPAGQAAAGYLPQLLVGAGADAGEQLRDRLASLDSLQPFGWMAGCVLDAQQDLAAATGDGRFADAAGRHLGALLTPDGRVARTAVGDGTGGGRGGGATTASPFRTVADTLAVAAIARRNPTHPLVDESIRFWQSRQDADGCVRDDAGTGTLGAYTVAYPMAVVAAARRAGALADQASRQLTLRLRRLVRDGQLRAFAPAGGGDGTGSATAAATAPAGRRGTRDRGGPATVGSPDESVDGLALAWWLLGLARTLRELPPTRRPVELTAELARAAEWARRRQRPDGTWSAVVGGTGKGDAGGGGNGAGGVDTAATAGIGAAMALADKTGMLPPTSAAAARKALGAVRARLTPDGYLAGVAPRAVGAAGAAVADPVADGRVIAPYAMGLAGQLLAALQPSIERA